MIQIGNNGYNMDFISAQIEKTISNIKVLWRKVQEMGYWLF